MIEHRSSERGFYDKLQQPEFAAARELLESLLGDPRRTYEEICRSCKSSGLFEDIKDVTPQDLTRYRQRQAREEQRGYVQSLLASDAQAIIEGAAKNPGGILNQFLRRQLSEHVIGRFDEEMEKLDALALSREAARHAQVEQRDRKLDLETEKLELENRRIELQEKAADLQRDRYKIATDLWVCVLGFYATRNATVADQLTRDSNELLKELEAYVETAAA